MNVRITERAYRDLVAIGEYLTEHAPESRQSHFTVFEETFVRLVHMPNMGRITSEHSVRMVLASKYPYKIFYRVTLDTIDIVHIRHTSRTPMR